MYTYIEDRILPISTYAEGDTIDDVAKVFFNRYCKWLERDNLIYAKCSKDTDKGVNVYCITYYRIVSFEHLTKYMSKRMAHMLKDKLSKEVKHVYVSIKEVSIDEYVEGGLLN